MKNHLDNLLVFATNINTETDRQKISIILDEHSEILHWNVDQEDIDCVLRIVSETLSEQQIMTLIDAQNFECKALD